jgi:hypothetical protein
MKEKKLPSLQLVITDYLSIDFVVNRFSTGLRCCVSGSLLDLAFGSTSRIIDKEILKHCRMSDLKKLRLCSDPVDPSFIEKGRPAEGEAC